MHEATAAYEATLTVDVIRAFEAFVEDLSNWYIRRSRPRFWQEDAAAFRTLWYALVQSLRAVAPVMPFLTEHLWLNLVPDGPASIHLAGWPDVPEPDRSAARRDRGGPPRGQLGRRRARDLGPEGAPAAAAARGRGRGRRRRRTRARSPTSCA